MTEKTIPDGPQASIGDGWIASQLKIQVPFASTTGAESRESTFTVDGFHRRKIVPLIKDVLENDPAVRDFHFSPYRQTWSNPATPDLPPQRVFDEVYSSDAFIEADIAVQQLPRPPSDTTPRAVAALMLASDSTHLTSFGTAKIWPVYLAFGNQSKYDWCKPSSYAMHHLAYLPSVSQARIVSSNAPANLIGSRCSFPTASKTSSEHDRVSSPAHVRLSLPIVAESSCMAPSVLFSTMSFLRLMNMGYCCAVRMESCVGSFLESSLTRRTIRKSK